MTVSVDIETMIDRPPADVFAALIDVERYPEWLIASGIVRVERLDPGPLGQGLAAPHQPDGGRPLDGPRRQRDRAGAGGEVRAAGQGQGRGHDRDRRRARPAGTGDAPALVARAQAAAPLPDVRIDGRAAGQARRGARPRGASSAAWSRPPRAESGDRAEPGGPPRGHVPPLRCRHPSIRPRAGCRCPPGRAPPTLLSSGSHHGRPAGRSQTPCSIRTSSEPGSRSPSHRPFRPAPASLPAARARTPGSSRTGEPRSIAAVARRHGETADRVIAPDPEWRLPAVEGA